MENVELSHKARERRNAGQRQQAERHRQRETEGPLGKTIERGQIVGTGALSDGLDSGERA